MSYSQILIHILLRLDTISDDTTIVAGRIAVRKLMRSRYSVCQMVDGQSNAEGRSDDLQCLWSKSGFAELFYNQHILPLQRQTDMLPNFERHGARLPVVAHSECSSRPILVQILKSDITEDFSLCGRKLVRLTKRILIVKRIEVTKSR